MSNYKALSLVICLSLFTITGIFYSTHARADGNFENQNENLDELTLESDLLQTSTDDIQAQAKEAKEQARLAKQEEAQALSKLKRTKTEKSKVEQVAQKRIGLDRQLQVEARKKRDRYLAETRALEKEIVAIEGNLEKSRTQTKTMLVQLRHAKEQNAMARQRRNAVKNTAKQATKLGHKFALQGQ